MKYWGDGKGIGRQEWLLEAKRQGEREGSEGREKEERLVDETGERKGIEKGRRRGDRYQEEWWCL